MIKNYNQIAKDILANIRYATIATVTPDGKGWNTPVAHDIDQDYNIYWYSDKENQHSVNIRNNPHVFIVVYDSTAPDGEGEGVYIEALAEEMIDPETINKALGLNQGNTENANNFLGDSIRRCYRAVPKRIWVNDAEEKDGVFVRDYRVEVTIINL